MTWLSENPWPLVGILGVAVVGFLIALATTQNAKNLVWAVVCLVLALVVLGVEHFWITDNERIELVVEELRSRTANSDGDGVIALMTPDVSYTQTGVTLGGAQARLVQAAIPKGDPNLTNPVRLAIREAVNHTRFDFITFSHLRTSAGQQTRMGKAEFRAHGAGTSEMGGFTANFATDPSGTDWALGFREVNGRWMIESIDAMRVPRNWPRLGAAFGR